MIIHCDICLYIHDRSYSHSGYSIIHYFLLDFLKGRSMEEIGTKCLCHNCCGVFYM